MIEYPNQSAEDALHLIAAPLLDWYSQHTRILPWRENTAPYGVWVSEIMLQQTRVETVKPYFDRFMAELPTLVSLAQAPEERLLKLWEGLGYYNRARNLQKTAQMIVGTYQGEFPATYEELVRLPGVGAYTAGAILSICFGVPVPAVDGNVMRVVTRLTANPADILQPKVKQQITAELRAVYPRGRSGDFTQSLMELGAMICTPSGNPKCDCCPLGALCMANYNGTQLDYPVKAKNKPRRSEDRTVLLLCFEDTVAVCKRPPKGLLGGLWEFPNAIGQLTTLEVMQLVTELHLTADQITALPPQKHIFTHLEWHMSGYRVDCRCAVQPFSWVTRADLIKEFALPSAFRMFCAFFH